MKPVGPAWRFGVAGLGVVAAACGAAAGPDPGPREVATVVISTVPDTLRAIGESRTLTATARDAAGNPVGDAVLAWSSSAPNVATVSTAGVVTAVSNGSALVSARAGTGADTVEVVVQQEPSALRIETQPGPAESGAALDPQPVVEIVDAGGALVQESAVGSVRAAIESGGGTLQGDVDIVPDDGVATFVDLAIEGNPGPRRLRFSADGLPDLSSDEFGVGPVGVPSQIALSSGNNQSGPVDTRLPAPLAVVVRDAANNPVPGVMVDWVVTAGDATVPNPSTATGGNGVASTALDLGSSAGGVTVEGRAAGLAGSPVVFTATATPPQGADTVYVERFALANGSMWPAPWEEIPESAILVADVQSGRARFSAEDGASVGDRLGRMRHLGIDERDAEIDLIIEFEEIDRQGLGFYFRHNGGFLTRTTPAGQGYAFFIEGGSGAGERIGLWREIDGVETRHTQATITVQNGVPYRVRYQVVQIDPSQTVQRARIWPASDSEPGAWTVEATTSFPELQNLSGGMILDIFNYGGSSAHVFVDDIVITRVSP